MRRSLVVVLGVLPLISGCLGGGEPAAGPIDSGPLVVAPSSSSAPLPTDGIDPPKYHPHDLWGDRASVILFAASVGIGGEPVKETSYQGETRIVSGYREFDPRADGDDSTSFDKADVVFQGTKALVVKLKWSTDPTQANIPGLSFLYKPANSARFTKIENVPNDGEVYIPVQKGMADMPHQLKLSRWRFAVEAFDAQFANQPTKVHVGRGEVAVSMTALNGGVTLIDPPHPYNFLESTEVPAGEIQRSVDATVVQTETTGTTNVQGDPPMGWQVPAPFIVPWETTTLRVQLTYTYAGPASAVPHELRLRYTDASGPEVKTPTPVRTGPGEAYYEIQVLANQADDPYAKKSDWTWGVQPVVNGLEAGGDFKGDVKLTLVAVGTNEAPQ